MISTRCSPSIARLLSATLATALMVTSCTGAGSGGVDASARGDIATLPPSCGQSDAGSEPTPLQPSRPDPRTGLSELELDLIEEYAWPRRRREAEMALDQAVYVSYFGVTENHLHFATDTRATVIVDSISFPTRNHRLKIESVVFGLTRFGDPGELVRKQLSALETSRDADAAYEPRCLLSYIVDGSEVQHVPTEKHVVWAWWPSWLGHVPLAHLAHWGITGSSSKVRKVQRDDEVLAYLDPVTIRFTEDSDFGKSGLGAFSQLVWWKLGTCYGVAIVWRPQSILLLVESGVFRFETVEIEVVSVDPDNGVELRVSVHKPLLPAD